MACLKVLRLAFGLGVFFPDSELAFFSIFSHYFLHFELCKQILPTNATYS